MNTFIRKINYLIILMNLLFVSNCFLNPFVQNFISPVEVEDNSSLFALLALGGQSLVSPSGTATTIISGKLTDLSSNPLANATLSIFTIISSQTKSLTRIESSSSSSFTDTNGNFSFAGTSGNFRINVNGSSGNSLGSFDLFVNSTGDSASLTNSSGANFILSQLTANPINTTTTPTSFTVGGTIIGTVWGSSLCSADTIELRNTSNSEVILVNSGNVNFAFVTPLASGSAYNITINTAPSFYSCSVTANGSGTIASSDVTNVTIDCGISCP
jgi:hypothetical protein